MAQRPGSGDSDEERFNWLYGGPGSPGSEPEADATRRMPVQPRPQPASRPAPQPAQPVQPVQPPAQPPTQHGRGGRSWRPRPRLRHLVLLLVAWIVFLVAVPIYAWTRVDDVAFAPGGDRPDEQPGTTYLLVGSDSREGLTPEQRKEFGTGNAAGQRTDTIMLLHTGSGPNLLMSIPRDSLVEVPDRGTTKINAAYAFGGPKLLVKTIEQNTGIHIDEYVEIGIGGFVGLVDAVGGVEICPEKAMQDPLANLDVKAGCQEADGVTALGYARSRKTYTALGDVQRAQAQREVVSSVGDEVLSPWSVLNPLRYWRLNMAATDTVEFGKGMTPWRAGMWAMAMTRVNGESGLTCGVPIQDLQVNWDPDRAPQMFQAIIDDDTDRIGQGLCSPSGLPKGTTG